MKTKSKTAAADRGRRQARPAGDAADQLLPYGSTRIIALNLPEFAAVVAALELPPPNRLSPLPDLMAPGSKGQARSLDEVLRPVRGLDPDTLSWAFGGIAIPDRILDMRGTPWAGTPSLCRLYSNRLFPSYFVGLRPALATDYELLAPFTAVDLEVFARVEVQFSAGQPPHRGRHWTGEDLTFPAAPGRRPKGGLRALDRAHRRPQARLC